MINTVIFGFTGIVFNGIPALTENFSSPKLIFIIKSFGFNEFPGLTEKMVGPEPSGKSENLSINLGLEKFSVKAGIPLKTISVNPKITVVDLL